jgi:hypothetical protein
MAILRLKNRLSLPRRRPLIWLTTLAMATHRRRKAKMLHSSYAFLIGITVIANCKEWRMLALSLLIAANVLLPMPGRYAEDFYLSCIIAELIVIAGAVLLRTAATLLIVEVSVVLIVMHVMAYYGNGHLPLSPYRVLVKLCEYTEIFTCIMFSKGFFKGLRNRYHDA